MEKLDVYYFGDLYIQGTFASFHQLQVNHGLPKKEILRYLQAGHFVKTNLGKYKIKYWEKELGSEMSGDLWERSLRYGSLCSLNALHYRLIWFKFFIGCITLKQSYVNTHSCVTDLR